MFSLALKIGKAIAKYGSKAWTAIKNGAYKYYNAAKEAWEGGLWSFAKWLAGNYTALEAIKAALEAAGLL
ncbi:hypothetical protein [Halobacillus sp. A5]|uniref:hypothetical protein n=1 Tax=Halobacillus sp. A5 TaxID=2880263 RepID=UPI0020A62CE1|nr:hypothetical protein [Halobacillus sp. A5]MCP3029627.1 hypothetical protein [Halobacillus sp. A5]